MRYLRLTLFLLLFCALPAAAQKKVILQGTVMDAADRATKIPGVAVQLLDSTNGIETVLQETVTNNSGDFIFEMQLPDTARVRYSRFPLRFSSATYEFAYAQFPAGPVKTVTYEALRGNVFLRKKSTNPTLPQQRSSVRINGLVVDSLNNMPLQAAKVTFSQNGKVVYTAIAQPDGGFITPAFSVSPNEADSLIINAVVEVTGYREGVRKHAMSTIVDKRGLRFSDAAPVISMTILMVPEKKKTVKLIPKDN